MASESSEAIFLMLFAFFIAVSFQAGDKSLQHSAFAALADIEEADNGEYHSADEVYEHILHGVPQAYVDITVEGHAVKGH